MKILVTGGAGFIGSHIVDALVRENYDVVVIDNLSTGKKEQVNDQAKLIVLDITDQQLADAVDAEKPQAVIHCAAQIDLQKSIADPVWDAQQNIIGSLNLLEACRRAGVGRLIFSSTGGVYGDTKQIPTPEIHPTAPPSPYGIAKLTIETYLGYYYATYGMSYAALRYSNVYGPRQGTKGESGVVSIFCQKLLAGETPVINGSGEQTRDYLFVSDVVSANIKALDDESVGVFNISTGTETSINTLAALIKESLGSDISFEHGSAKKIDQARSALDCSKAQKTFGFAPRVDIKEGIKLTAEYFKRVL